MRSYRGVHLCARPEMVGLISAACLPRRGWGPYLGLGLNRELLFPSHAGWMGV